MIHRIPLISFVLDKCWNLANFCELQKEHLQSALWLLIEYFVELKQKKILFMFFQVSEIPLTQPSVIEFFQSITDQWLLCRFCVHALVLVRFSTMVPLDIDMDTPVRDWMREGVQWELKVGRGWFFQIWRKKRGSWECWWLVGALVALFWLLLQRTKGMKWRCLRRIWVLLEGKVGTEVQFSSWAVPLLCWKPLIRVLHGR